ncbi:MAG: OmpH family outer membrane protein [bacterium]
MTKIVWRASLLAFGISALAFAQAQTAPTKVGIINIQQAIVATKDGQKAIQQIEAKFGPRRTDFEKRQQELMAKENQYRQGANTMAEEARTALMREIDLMRKQLQRDMDDAQAELEQEQNRILQDLGGRMMTVIDKYAKDNGYALILDVSNPQTPVLYASNTIEITRDIIDLYDKGAAVQPAASVSGAAGAQAATTQPAAAPKQ